MSAGCKCRGFFRPAARLIDEGRHMFDGGHLCIVTKRNGRRREPAMSNVSQLVKQSKTDGAAAMALAQCRLYGIDCKPDRRAAFNAVRLAASLGHPDGRRARIYLTEAGIGTKP